MGYAKFSEFADPEDCGKLGGEKKKLDDILNIEILLKKYRISKSKHNQGNYITLQFELEGKLYVAFTGSQVIIDQVKKYSEKLPFFAKIIKVGKSYSLS
jgi:hypothetical protein